MVGQALRYTVERHFHSYDLKAKGVSDIDDGGVDTRARKLKLYTKGESEC